MPPKKPTDAPVALIHGEDLFDVRQRAKAIFERWCQEAGGMDHEVIDGAAGSVDEARRAIARLREGLQTLPFFGTSKVIWFQGCTFLGEDRTGQSETVKSAVTELAEELARFQWEGVRLVISASKVDRRRGFYKTLEKIAVVEERNGFSAQDRDWATRAEAFVEDRLGGYGQTISSEACAALVAAVGPNLPLLQAEVDKLATYAGGRDRVETRDVEAVAVRNKQARAFALGDALGDRDVPRLLRALDEEMWAIRGDRDRSEIGLVYGVVSKVRSMLLAKQLIREKQISPEADYGRFKAQLERMPTAGLPEDRRYNPGAMNAYVLYKAAQQARHYTAEELVAALETLLECNLRLVSSSGDNVAAVRRALVAIARRP